MKMVHVCLLVLLALLTSCVVDFSTGGSELCGNGILNVAEECDDGNGSPADGCDDRCRIEPGWSCSDLDPSLCGPSCGDGLVVGDETCDGINLDGKSCALFSLGNGDLRCGANCQLDLSSCGTGACGDGLADPGEECDGNDVNGHTCESNGYTGDALACGSDCSLDTSGCSLLSCGNGILDTVETCDDGNTVPGDGCSANCSVEAGWECAGQPSVCTSQCGNGQLDAGEPCDGPLLVGQSCQTLGFDGGALACSASCTLDTYGCQLDSCGNGQLDAAEQCDGGDLAGQTCQSVGGYVGGSLLCQPSCAFDVSGCVATQCGDSIVSPGEACDDGNTSGGDGCSVLCNVEAGWSCAGEPSSCSRLCGNGQLDVGEVCDGANLGGETCQSLGFSTGQLSCSGSCIHDTSGCSVLTCGNGQLDAPEQCDGNDLGGETCQSQGFLSGTLGCTPSCSFDTNSCSAPTCGDGVISSNIGEQCDDGNTGGGDGCSGSCQVENGWLCSGQPSGCIPSCGNGSVNPGEECDANDLNGATCTTLGYDSGTLTCTSFCSYNTGGCVNQCYRCPLDSATYGDLGTCNAQCVNVQSCSLQSVGVAGALTIMDCDFNQNCNPNFSLGRISASGSTITLHHDGAAGWSTIGTLALTNATASGDVTIVNCDGLSNCNPDHSLGRITASGNTITFYHDGSTGWSTIGSITLSGATASGDVIIHDCDWNNNCTPDHSLGRITASGNLITFHHDGAVGWSTIGSITLTATNFVCPIQAMLPCSGSPPTCTEFQSCVTTTTNCP